MMIGKEKEKERPEELRGTKDEGEGKSGRIEEALGLRMQERER